MNLYDVLGVHPTATADEVRAAYRRAARMHHPDARGDEQRMATINAAWHVLGHPQRRAEYDRTLRPQVHAQPPPRPRPAPPPPVEPRRNPLARYQSPPRFPWRPMVIIGAVATVLVLVTSALRTESPAERPVDRILRPGECVAFEPNGDAAEVSCDDPHDAVVDELVDTPEQCRAGTDAHRDRQGLGFACVVPG